MVFKHLGIGSSGQPASGGNMLSLILLLTVNVLALLIYLQTAGWGHPGQHRFEGGSSQGSLLSAVLSGHALEAPGHQLRSLIATMTRAGIPATLQAEGLKVGAELGVQNGEFAAETLQVWKSCERYYLVDLWGHQANYNDLANVNDSEQEKRYQQTRANLLPWEDKTVFLRNYTVEAAKQIPDNSLDYVYVDARHDYCGVMEDLETYWPKLGRGGILAGHDYVTADDPSVKGSNQDWSLCLNGTRNMGAVKGAVDEFARKHGLQIMVTYRDWPSFMARKP